MRRLVAWTGGLIMLGTFGAAFMAYFTFSIDPATGAVYDGLGRRLSADVPFLVRWFLEFSSGGWVGWRWFVADFVWFWGGMAAGFMVLSWGTRGARRKSDGAA